MLEELLHPIDIRVETDYIDNQSDPANERFVFGYRITICNRSLEPLQLISRYWRITDGDGALQEVQGEGVVGEQPRILPGDSYSYSSGTVLSTEVGSMEGHYVMRTDAGEQMTAPIPPFTLAVPGALH